VYRRQRGAKCDYEFTKRYLPREKDSRIVQFSEAIIVFGEGKMVVSHRYILLDLCCQFPATENGWLTLHDGLTDCWQQSVVLCDSVDLGGAEIERCPVGLIMSSYVIWIR